MINEEKTELYIAGYMQALVGHEFTQKNYNVIFSHIDSMLHKINADKIETTITPPAGKFKPGLFD